MAVIDHTHADQTIRHETVLDQKGGDVLELCPPQDHHVETRPAVLSDYHIAHNRFRVCYGLKSHFGMALLVETIHALE